MLRADRNCFRLNRPVFTAQRSAKARYLLSARGVRLSVHHVRVLYPDTAEDIVKLFSRPLAPSFSGGDKYTGGAKVCEFRLKSPLTKISKIRRCLTAPSLYRARQKEVPP